jgi:hypothetical protein
MRSPKHFLDAGFHVLCEKPMTMTVDEGEDIVRTAKASGKVCAVNYAYSAYPMIRHMRHMVDAGDLGAIRTVVANFSHGHHAAGDDADNPRVRWRYDPAQAGVSARWPIAAFMPCIWRVLSWAMRLKSCRLISPPPCRAGCWKTMRW